MNPECDNVIDCAIKFHNADNTDTYSFVHCYTCTQPRDACLNMYNKIHTEGAVIIPTAIFNEVCEVIEHRERNVSPSSMFLEDWGKILEFMDAAKKYELDAWISLNDRRNRKRYL